MIFLLYDINNNKKKRIKGREKKLITDRKELQQDAKKIINQQIVVSFLSFLLLLDFIVFLHVQ